MSQETRIAELERKVETLVDIVAALSFKVEALETPAQTLRDRINARQAELREARQ